MDHRCTIRTAGYLTFVGLLAACSAKVGARSARVTEDPAYVDDDLIPSEPGYVEEDSGANLPEESNDSGFPSALAGLCSAPLAPGDLQIVELMIAAKAGSEDSGEWVEVRNTRACALQLQGVTIESPRGNASSGGASGGPVPAGIIDKAQINAPLTLPPGGTLLIANKADPIRDAKVAGAILLFGVNDVLKNEGDTVRIVLGPVLIDTITFPRTNIPVGTSLSFPSNCVAGQRPDFQRWKPSLRNYAIGMKGTPGLPNDDVKCF